MSTLHATYTIEGKPFGATWIVRAPWAHPLWTHYALLLADLTTDTGEPPHIYKEGVTHELQVYAMDPRNPTTVLRDNAPSQLALLHPANHVYQFAADSDAAAVERVHEIVRRIEGRGLSPDTDYTYQWDQEFKDGVSLKKGVAH